MKRRARKSEIWSIDWPLQAVCSCCFLFWTFVFRCDWLMALALRFIYWLTLNVGSLGAVVNSTSAIFRKETNIIFVHIMSRQALRNIVTMGKISGIRSRCAPREIMLDGLWRWRKTMLDLVVWEPLFFVHVRCMKYERQEGQDVGQIVCTAANLLRIKFLPCGGRNMDYNPL